MRLSTLGSPCGRQRSTTTREESSPEMLERQCSILRYVDLNTMAHATDDPSLCTAFNLVHNSNL